MEVMQGFWFKKKTKHVTIEHGMQNMKDMQPTMKNKLYYWGQGKKGQDRGKKLSCPPHQMGAFAVVRS